MDLATFRWLLTPPGQRLLAAAEAAYAEHPTDPVVAAAALRGRGSADHTAATLTQARLRRRASDKFGDLAAAMYFTPDGLEQATRRRVAAHRAARVALAGPSSVLDAGCGIGGDLVALAHTGLVVAGVDRDPVTVAVAEANLAALGLGGAVRVADATAVDLPPFGLVFADPSRRTSRGRVFDPAAWSPPWSFVETLLAGRACVKTAPGIPHRLVPEGVEAEWVSEDGEVKEACLWSPPLAAARRRATVIPSTELRTSPSAGSGQAPGGLATLSDEDDPGSPGVRRVGAFLYEPDGAVIRAGLVTAVAAGVNGGLVDRRIAYVTGDEPFVTPFARSYRVLEELPFHEKQLRAALRARNIGALTIKKRGVQVAPEQLRKRLALSGDEEATIVLTRVAGKGTTLLVRPLQPV
jgi:SAM-dependent methyltransferase